MEHLPTFYKFENQAQIKCLINNWWTCRSMPSTRPGIKSLRKHLRLLTSEAITLKSMGLSLTDQYWVQPEDMSETTWDQVNFFKNQFSNDLSILIFKLSPDPYGIINILKENLSYYTPDSTTDGTLQKTWRISNERRILFKNGAAPYFQEPFNEVIASKIMEKLHINHVNYDLFWIKEGDYNEERPYSWCECFITPDTELIKASQILEMIEKPPNTSTYQHFIDCCHALGIKDFVQSLDQMLLVDFLIANEDRHFNNFGFIRNASTLEWIGFAPIYDSGNSLWYNQREDTISSHKDLSKPFENRHYKQVKYISNFDLFDLEAIKEETFLEEIRRILENIRQENNRVSTIISGFQKRISLIEKLVSFKKQGIDFDPESDLDFNPDYGKKVQHYYFEDFPQELAENEL